MTKTDWGIIKDDIMSSLNAKILSRAEYERLKEEWAEHIAGSMSGLIVVWPEEREYIFFEKEK